MVSGSLAQLVVFGDLAKSRQRADEEQAKSRLRAGKEQAERGESAG